VKKKSNPWDPLPPLPPPLSFSSPISIYTPNPSLSPLPSPFPYLCPSIGACKLHPNSGGHGTRSLLSPTLSLSSVPFFSLLPSHLPPLPLEVGPLNPARKSGEALYKLPRSRGLGRSPNRCRILCILALKYNIWWHQCL